MTFYCWRTRRRLLVGLMAVWALAGVGSAYAGGVNLGNDEDSTTAADQGPSFFGFVRDAAGPAIGDAKVTASLTAGGALVTRTNSLGVYKFSGFGKDIDPDSVTISCAKDGYKQADVLRRPHAKGDKAEPIEVECTLQKE
jgi:hypothetical protein